MLEIDLNSHETFNVSMMLANEFNKRGIPMKWAALIKINVGTEFFENPELAAEIIETFADIITKQYVVLESFFGEDAEWIFERRLNDCVLEGGGYAG